MIYISMIKSENFAEYNELAQKLEQKKIGIMGVFTIKSRKEITDKDIYKEIIHFRFEKVRRWKKRRSMHP